MSTKDYCGSGFGEPSRENIPIIGAGGTISTGSSIGGGSTNRDGTGGGGSISRENTGGGGTPLPKISWIGDYPDFSNRHTTPQPAIGFLEEARLQMEARAKLRDTPKGERTAKKIAEVFNAITGKNMTEAEAWLFLIVLKIVRGKEGSYNRDDYVDLAAYASLLGECESVRERHES